MKLKTTKWNEKAGSEYTANGLIRINTNKPEYGSLMLMAVVVTISNGFANQRNKVGFVTGEVVQLEAMIKEFGLKEGVDFSKAVAEHKIVTLEVLETELGDKQGYSAKMNPNTGEILAKGGVTIMRKTEVVAEGSDLEDTYISHDTETAEDTAKVEFEAADKAAK